MGFWIAPLACLSAAVAPLGLAEPVLRSMGLEIEYILTVAHWIGSLPGAVQPVRAAGPAVIALITAGGLWLALWRGTWRLAGSIAVAAGLAVWHAAPPRPELLVAPEARLIGFMGPEGRVLDKKSAQSFAAEIWLRRDGDPADQARAATRPGFERAGRILGGRFSNGWRLAVHEGRPEPADLDTLCQPRTLLIARNGGPTPGQCLYFGKEELRSAGALAVSADGDGLAIRRARDETRGRPWAPP